MYDLLQNLINISSITGHEGELGFWLGHWFEAHAYTVERQLVSEGRFNILARAVEQPRLWFCTHLDTVAPHIAFHEEAERIYGRGACDAKGILYAMLLAAERLRATGCPAIGFLLVVGEEHASDGAKKAATLSLAAEHIILGEPTDNHLVSLQKGALVFQMQACGRSGHSGYPELGYSAIHHLMRTLADWLQQDWGHDPDLGATTLNIGALHGGRGANIIADHAQADGLFRLTVDPEAIINRLEAAECEHLKVQVLSASAPQKLLTLDGYAHKTVSFGSDAAYLRSIAPVLMIGPGSIHFAHREDEQISKQELVQAIALYEKLAIDLLK